MIERPLILTGNLSSDSLSGKTVLVTGGGGGIGLEAARALAFLGSRVVIAEIDEVKGTSAESDINSEIGEQRVHFVHSDISDEEGIKTLAAWIRDGFGIPYAIINNATVAPMGAVHTVAMEKWDMSYAVNLRAPILLTREFLPDMLQRGSGALVFVPSSGAAPFMGAYEVFKTAQVELCNTLVGELEDTGVFAYSIGPGLVGTDTALGAIRQVSDLMGISMDEFMAMNKGHIISAEAAGAGFAASVAMAEKYNGQEIGSIQALLDAGILLSGVDGGGADPAKGCPDPDLLSQPLARVVSTYEEQYAGWRKRNVFERQWVLRDFKKETGFSTEQVRDELISLVEACKAGNLMGLGKAHPIMAKLRRYYGHQLKLLAGYEKDPEKLRESTEALNGWIRDIEDLESLLKL